MKLSIKAITFLVLSLITLSVTIFAWVNMSQVSKSGPVNTDVTDFTNLIVFHVKRKDGVEYLIEDIEDMHEVFGDTEPGETYTFKFVIDNTTSGTRSIILDLRGVKTTDVYNNEVTDFDLRDVFYINQGQIVISRYIGENLMSEVTQVIPKNSEDIVVTPDGQTLNDYRLNNLINVSEKNIILTPTIVDIIAGERVEIVFTLVYDQDTTNIKYQDNMLNFLGIYIFGQ